MVDRLLIDSGADATARNDDGSTPLHAVALNAHTPGHVAIGLSLIAAGGNASATDSTSTSTPLHAACMNGHLEMVTMLVGMGSPVHATVKGDVTALHLAAHNGHVPVAVYLLGLGLAAGGGDESGQTPLHAAAYNGHAEVAAVLIAYGCRVDVRDATGATAQQLAATRGFGGWIDGIIEAQWAPTPKPPHGHGDPCALRRRLAAFHAFELSPRQSRTRADLHWFLELDDALLVLIDGLSECERLVPPLAHHGLQSIDALHRFRSAGELIALVGVELEVAEKLLGAVAHSWQAPRTRVFVPPPVE